ncbi:MAG: hypothetical protein M3023_01820 [Pseudomonadota bacterium]|nr:hypothetical protein [Pseudomonadota bacterium]
MLRNSRRTMIAGAFAAATLSGCYVVPVAPNGTPIYPATAAVAVPAPAAYAGSSTPSAAYILSNPAAPSVLQARLYPSNELATKTGVLAGTVTNLMTGKGRFELDYRGELLVGEATRSPSDRDGRRGVASAYGQRGTYMSCEYRMTTPYQGIGTCSLSSGALYQVHIGG